MLDAGRQFMQHRARAVARLQRIIAMALCGMAILVMQADAQGQSASEAKLGRRSFVLAVSVGGGGPNGSTRCIEGAYLFPTVEVVTRGRVFATASAGWILPFGGVEDCLRLPAVRATSDGGVVVRGDDRFDLDHGGAHIQSGLGVRGPFGLESRVEIGVARGQKHFRSELLVSGTATLGLSLLRNHLVVSLDRGWFRIPHWEQRFATEQEWREAESRERPEGAVTQWHWRAVHTLSLGARF